MYSVNELNVEIEKAMAALDHMSRLHPEWITAIVMDRYPKPSHDADLLFRHGYIRDAVRRRLNKFKGQAGLNVDKQTVLPGFERLQKRYLITEATEEGAEQVAVRVQDLTTEQLLEKAAEYEAMGQGCFQHAQELRRYADQVAAA